MNIVNRIQVFSQVRSLALFICLGALLSSCSTLPGGLGRSVRVDQHPPMIIMQSDEPLGWGRMSHTSLFRISSERLLLRYNIRGDVGPGSYSAGFSSDGGLTWDFDVMIDVVDPQRESVTRRSLADVASHFSGFISFSDYEFIMQINSVGGFRQREDGLWVARSEGYRSEDGGDTWIGPYRIHFETPYEVARMYVMQHGIRMPDDSLLRIAYTQPEARFTRYSVSLYRSTDGGLTWRHYSEVATADDAPWGRIGPCEPAILYLGDGRFVCVMRTDGSASDHSGAGSTAHMLLGRSQDGGNTWRLTRFPAGGVRPKLLEMDSGVIVLAAGRPGNFLMFSRDGGDSWSNYTAITPPSRRTSGYMGLVQVSPYRIFITYDNINETMQRFWLWEPQRVNTIFGRFVDIQ